MRKFILKIIPVILLFFLCTFCVQAAPVIKINGLEFDNSGNVVIVNSLGKVFPSSMQTPEDNDKSDKIPKNLITKGILTNPDRIFVDISNAVLSGTSRTYVLKNSHITSVKISQFSTNPHVVRIVFEHDKNFHAGDFSIFANDRQIIFKLSNTLISSEKFKTVYNNMTSGERKAQEYEATTYWSEFKQKVQNIVNVSNTTPNQSLQINTTSDYTYKDVKTDEKDGIMKSNFHLAKVEAVKNGLMIKGSGNLSLKSSFMLDNPSRLVIDLENTVVAQALRNKTYTIPNSKPLVSNGQVAQREILRVGQNNQTTARLVIQGENAKEYRVVVSPDLQGLFIAKRGDILNSKLTQTTSEILNYTASHSAADLDVVNITFSNPVAFTMFEENSKFYLDLQNVADLNKYALDVLHKNPDFKGITAQKIATEKTRVIFNLNSSTAINAQVSPDSKEIRIYFKKRSQTQTKEAPPAKKEEKEEKPQRPSTIKQMYSVVIDPGHGGADVGATREGVYEKDITLEVSKLLEKYLKKQDVYTHLTRETDKTVELSERSDFSNKINPNVFISIHVNSSVKEDIIGLETHWYHPNSLDFAKIVHKNFASSRNLSKWETKDRGLFQSKFYVINHTNAPAILVEIGFISNPFERKLLVGNKRQEEIAKSIAEGIMEYLKSQK